MAKYILSILRSRLMIVFSWGFHSAMAIRDGLAFRVQGYKHTGRVEVVYDEGRDVVGVRPIGPGWTMEGRVEGIYADGLVETIDRMVEKTDDYNERVRSQYGV